MSYEWRLKYSPDQPRVPAGDPHGGRWTSSTDGGMVTAAYFDPGGPGEWMIAGLEGAEREAFVGIVSGHGVRREHMEGLNVVTTMAHGYYPDWVVESGEHAGELVDGVYDDALGSIFLNPDGGVYNFTVVLHELGHHVTQGSPWKDTNEADALRIVADAYVSEPVRPRGWMRTGLRDYSFRDVGEFMADCYKVHIAGDPKMRKNLAALLLVDSLDDLFGERK